MIVVGVGARTIERMRRSTYSCRATQCVDVCQVSLELMDDRSRIHPLPSPCERFLQPNVKRHFATPLLYFGARSGQGNGCLDVPV